MCKWDEETVEISLQKTFSKVLFWSPGFKYIIKVVEDKVFNLIIKMNWKLILKDKLSRIITFYN